MPRNRSQSGMLFSYPEYHRPDTVCQGRSGPVGCLFNMPAVRGREFQTAGGAIVHGSDYHSNSLPRNTGPSVQARR